MNHRKLAMSAMLVLTLVVLTGPGMAGEVKTNALGMKLVGIEAGTFEMGSSQGKDCWDESPIHKVTIGKPFYMAETEVTIEQYKQFRPDYQPTEGFAPYAAGMSWDDAVAFCQWLSKKEGVPYRLPTEAEWEYACRAGTTTLYSSGDKAPEAEQANAWGLKNMHTGVREWCMDWYGDYPAQPQVDPVGAESGMEKVVRGGPLDTTKRLEDRKIFDASSSRASIAPSFGPYAADKKAPEADKRPGAHAIGFRVVQADMPNGKAVAGPAPFARQGIAQNTQIAVKGPDSAKPFFRKRYLLPTPPDNSSNEEILAVGMHPSFRHHNHSPALGVCPNGDVLLIIYTSYGEYEPDVSLIASRLRFGHDLWDMPSRMFDFATANDHAPMLYTDGGTVYFFWGNPHLIGGFPFNYTLSKDNGATWEPVHFPHFTGPIGPHSRQPINTALRDKNGTLYVASDAAGGSSVLWATKDNGKTWYDTGGRTNGRHTTFALLGDGQTILGMGGKNTNIEGYMPKSISTDGGKTYEFSKTPFASLGGNQRPSLVRLKSGRLFFAGDFQDPKGKKPADITQKGSFTALSDDDGKTWHIKPLPGAQQHEEPERLGGAGTIGYSAAMQAPNGNIHLITTMNRPCLHFEFNEAWILADNTGLETAGDADLMKSSAAAVTDVKEYKEQYPSGKTKLVRSGGMADDGRFLLNGAETWYYENGHKQREATYKLGRLAGTETYWTEDGKMLWQWKYNDDGSSVWTQYWPNGQKKAESAWRSFEADGTAALWDDKGNVTGTRTFSEGKMAK
jgi:formylglycine-generating enzyme required for sulfatase activity